MQINNHNDRDFDGPVAALVMQGAWVQSPQETRSQIPQLKILSATMKTQDP